MIIAASLARATVADEAAMLMSWTRARWTDRTIPRGNAPLRRSTSVSQPGVTASGVAMALDSVRRGRGAARVIVLMPWALPTVVAALVWRFMFETGTGVVGALGIPGLQRAWLSDPVFAWVPILLADTWKSTPFVTLLLLTGLQAIDPALHEAARMATALIAPGQ